MEETNAAPYSGGKDRISGLPDSLIHHILSFIDMRFAVQSCVLSKRWRYIWTTLPVLKFDVKRDYNIADFVDKVLWLRDSYCIQIFSLDALDEEDIDITRIYSWITVAVRRNVEELNISCRCYGDFVIPPCLCMCRSLIKLDLYIYGADAEDNPGKIVLPSSVSLPRLKSMSLDPQMLSFDDENTTNRFFSSCPALESLNLENCIFHNMHLNISLLKLKHFSYSNIWDVYDSTETFTLYAPNLTTFSCSNYKLRHDSLENLSSLVTAYICVEVEPGDKVPGSRIELLPKKKDLYARRMMKLVRTLHNVKSLTMSNYFKVLAEAPEIFGSQLPKYLNLRKLRLITWLSRECMQAIIFFLKISPNIESLCLDITTINSNETSWYGYPFCDEISFDSRGQEDYWCSELSRPGVLCHLKFVLIKGLPGSVNELKFLEVLLKKSMVLEKVVLVGDFELIEDTLTSRMLKFYEILLTFPKASTCTIIRVPSDQWWGSYWND